MLNEILDAVTGKLEELFGKDIVIYTNPMEQGFQRPCFFASFLEPSEKPLPGHRYLRENRMRLRYLPGNTEQPARELNQVADILMPGMEYIRLAEGHLICGTRRSVKISGGELDFFVNYNVFVTRQETPVERMENLVAKTRFRGGEV